MTKRRAANPYDRYRADAWDRVYARRGRDMTLTEVAEEIISMASATSLDALKWSAAVAAVEQEDRIRTSPPPSSQQPLLPGWPAPEGQFWKIGAAQRVRVADATADDHLTHVQFAETNHRAVDDAMRRTRDDYFRLAPFYQAGFGSVAAAVAAWQHGQGGAATP